MKRKIIIDLDGTISDDRYRQHLIKAPGAPDRFAAYHAQCGLDRHMNPGILALCRQLEADPVFVTSRPITVEAETVDWLVENTGISTLLLMRPRGNTDPSPKLKVDLIQGHLEQRGDIICAFEDRLDVIEAYQRIGILTVQVGYDSPALTAEPLPSIPELLRSGAKTFEERNAAYGETFHSFGKIMAALFPDGLKVDAGDVDKFNRLGVYVQIITKVSRYANSLDHVDSAHDAMVYSAMLEHLTRAK